jgi:hypothetical protein
MIVLVLYLTSIVCGLVYAGVQELPVTIGAYGLAVLNAFAMVFGSLLSAGGYLHVFRPRQMAEQVGWPPGGLFQKSVGIWNMAVGGLCIACPFVANSGFRTAAMLAMAGFWSGASFLHLQEARDATVGPETAPNRR